MLGMGIQGTVMQYRIVEDQKALDAIDHSSVFADVECAGCGNVLKWLV